MADLTIGAGYVKALLDLCLARGADLQELVRRSHIDPDALADRDARVPMEQYEALMRAGQELLGEPSLALLLGEAGVLSEISIVGLVCQTSETLGEAFAHTARLGRLVVEVDGAGEEGRFVIRREGGKTWLIDTRRDPNRFPELTESAFAMTVTSQARDYGHSFALEAHFTHDAPADRREYERIFDMPITFNSDRNGFVVRDNFLEFRLQPEGAPADRYVFGIFAERADALHAELKAASTTRGAVERLLLPQLHTGETEMEAIAERLGLTRQTLYRRLKSEGVTFEAVVDDLRRRMALDYLSARKVSVNETAYLTGFSDPSAFSRAFKRWTGQSPSAFLGKG